MEQGHCNNIIIEMKDYLIVVDANFPSGAPRRHGGCEADLVEAREVRLRHPSSRRSPLRQPRLDPGRRDHAGVRGRRPRR